MSIKEKAYKHYLMDHLSRNEKVILDDIFEALSKGLKQDGIDVSAEHLSAVFVTSMQFNAEPEDFDTFLHEEYHNAAYMQEILDADEYVEYLNDTLPVSDIRKTAYRKYQLDWMMRQGWSVSDIFRILGEYMADEDDPDVSAEHLQEVFEEAGFNGSCFVCFNEFLGAEYTDAAYMRSILNDEEYMEYETEKPERSDVVYLYKQYNDDCAYGEERIRVFKKKQDAMNALAEDVERNYGYSLEEMRNTPFMFGSDTLENDHVSITNDGGDTSFFIIEEHEAR